MEDYAEAPQVETPSYTDFMLMDREENDPADVGEVLDIGSSKED